MHHWLTATEQWGFCEEISMEMVVRYNRGSSSHIKGVFYDLEHLIMTNVKVYDQPIWSRSLGNGDISDTLDLRVWMKVIWDFGVLGSLEKISWGFGGFMPWMMTIEGYKVWESIWLGVSLSN